jgi:hypothetical protein
MRLGEAVLAKAADLVEDLLGELARQAALLPAVDQLPPELIDDAGPSPRSHRPAELIGLARRKAGRHHRQPHCLLLKERHAECLVQHGSYLFAGIRRHFLAIAPSQVGTHHVPLNGPRPDDCHFDYQVVKLPRLEARQHAHLGPALNLKHADRVGPTDHVIDAGVFGGDGGEGEFGRNCGLWIADCGLVGIEFVGWAVPTV